MRGIEKYERYLGARYRTLRYAFDEFERIGGGVVVELGTSRSFVGEGRKGCMINDPRYWRPKRPKAWDWGAGIFTRMCAEHLERLQPEIHSVDVSRDAIEIARTITSDFEPLITFHEQTSESFLRRFPGRVDLLYMDAGETVAGTQALHLRDAEIVVERDLVPPGGIVLIDDVNVLEPEESKGKYSIPYLRDHGFEIKILDYQAVLQRVTPER